PGGRIWRRSGGDRGVGGDGGAPAEIGRRVRVARRPRDRRRGEALRQGEAQPLGDPARLTQGRKRGILATALGRRLTVGPEILDLVVQVRILAPQPSFVRGASLLVKWGCFFCSLAGKPRGAGLAGHGPGSGFLRLVDLV